MIQLPPSKRYSDSPAAARRRRNRAKATKFVRRVNSMLRCRECGAQPIEWHGEHHPGGKDNARVSSLRSQGCSIARIKQEMRICTPLCRSCHMRIDGRAAKLTAARPQKKGDVIVPPKPCSCCGRMAKPTRNGMCVTCDNHHSGRRLRKTPSCDGCCAPPPNSDNNPKETL